MTVVDTKYDRAGSSGKMQSFGANTFAIKIMPPMVVTTFCEINNNIRHLLLVFRGIIVIMVFSIVPHIIDNVNDLANTFGSKTNVSTINIMVNYNM